MTIPLEPPVTTATLPSSRKRSRALLMGLLSFRCVPASLRRAPAGDAVTTPARLAHARRRCSSVAPSSSATKRPYNTRPIGTSTLCGAWSWPNILLYCNILLYGKGAEGDDDTPYHATTRRVCGLYFPVPPARRGC